MSEADNKNLWVFCVAALATGLANAFLFVPDLFQYAISDTRSIGLGLLCAMPILVGIVAGLIFEGFPVFAANVFVLVYLAATAPILREGIICIIMYAPIAMIATSLAALITRWIVKRTERGSAKNFALIFFWLASPTLIAKMDRLWIPETTSPISVADAMDVPLSEGEIWKRIEVTHFQFRSADLPLSIRALMPMPTALTGFGARVGDTRLVDFHNGRVTATVTQSQFPKHFEFTLALESHGPEFFNHWVNFEKSSFDFAPVAPGVTRVTHTTTYVPRVFPRWYFQPVENYLSHRLQAHMLSAFFTPSSGTVEMQGLAER